MKTKTDVIRKQLEWADSHEEQLLRDEKYIQYTKEIEGNLFRNNLGKEAKSEFENADGSELKDGRYPAKIKALYSSSALGYNVFEYWRKRDKSILANALGIEDEITYLTLEKKLETGISTPNIDIFLWLKNGKSVAIESKFCEWMDSKKNKKFKERYFTENGKQVTRWKDAGLPNCQLIANEIQFNGLNFTRLDATQLLKHALGIEYTKNIDAQLIYLYYDLKDENSRIRNEHSKELKMFTAKINKELNFKAISYQKLFESMMENRSKLNREYRDYLIERYFPEF